MKLLVTIEEDRLIEPAFFMNLLEKTNTGTHEDYLQIVDDINKGCYSIKRRFNPDTEEPFLEVETPNAHLYTENMG